MVKRPRRLLSAAILGALLGGAGAILIVTNPPPEVSVSADLGEPPLPYVVKLHARWCPICMATKGAWASVQSAYAGRVKFAVFDFTSAGTTEASRDQARRLGLEAVFDEYEGETGTVLVLDRTSGEVRQALHGLRNQGEYRAAIDAALKDAVE
jgi:hypothetical protein